MRLDVIKNARLYVSISSVVILAGLVAMVISFQQLGSPLRLGIDFTGGSSITLGLACDSTNNCGKKIDVGVVRQAIESKGFANSVIQSVEGKDLKGISVRTARLTTEQRENLRSILADTLKQYGEIDAKKSQIDEVGPSIGQQALSNGLLALAISFAGIGIFLAFRFQLDYASFAIIALFHDIFVTAGIFSILGLTLGVEIDSLFIVAMLTICGFSVNDTVVIYDRIRENVKIDAGATKFNELVNASINQTLGRSMNTTLTSTLPLIAIFLFGGATLRFFSLALIIGFLSGVYSSIFNASIFLAWWRSRQTPKISQQPLESN
ncbi:MULTISPECIES: protein translocase subunit SecF [Pseudanabaena]|jgi:preprotein translocase subunit SecF|uniref:protein translocase subunit SecF n=1 Tax=Pseudanabaena TaxID=1152 RepID=UPI002479F556|nr:MULTISPECIES: protein translocase subunit SecF [Pseudanabaena]MEA5488679.1 protein translocase subunit SecF [Pseudanabaena sp. CCNP1317]WGS72146.1 protein translocase subunit SecF [Pseudanabaena galeata CCNP1313]